MAKKIGRTSSHARFYDAIQFPLMGHWLFEVADETYNRRIIGSLIRGVPLVEVPAFVEFKTVANPDRPMDLSFSLMGVPLASPKVAEVFARVAASDVQLIPARVDSVDSGYYAVNITSRVSCPGPRVPGKLNIVHVGGQNIFRVEEMLPEIVLSDRLKRALEDVDDLIISGFVPYQHYESA